LEARAYPARKLAIDQPVLKPAGLENAKDIITASYSKDPADAAWKDDPGLKRFSDFIDKHMPGEDDELTQRGEEYDQLREFSVVQLIGARGLAAERMRRAGSAGEQRFHLLARRFRRHGGTGSGQA